MIRTEAVIEKDGDGIGRVREARGGMVKEGRIREGREGVTLPDIWAPNAVNQLVNESIK